MPIKFIQCFITLDRRPTPGKYENIISDFKKRNAGPSFGIARQYYEKVYMRSKVYPHDKNIPGPGSYKLPDKKGVQYSMRGRTKIQDSVHINVKNNIPGPGAYSSLTTFSPKGDNFVSTIR